MKKFLTTTVLLGASATALLASERPNVIIFLVDDLGWNDTSLPMAGEMTKYNHRYVTPNLERLAQEGVMLTNAHAQALSVPSRASLMSGQNSARNGVSGDYEPTVNSDSTLLIEPGRVFDPRPALPKLFKNSGYKTIHCGKFHLSEYKSDVPSPYDLGFDVNIAGSQHGQPGSFYPKDDYTHPNITKKHGRNVMVGLEEYYGSDKYLTEALTLRAIEEINSAVKDNQPFFLYLAHFAVHTPIQGDDKYMHHYKTEPGESKDEAMYGSMITGMDASMGQIMETLEKLNIDDNTLLIFYSDNGGRVLWRGKKSLYGDYDFNYPARSGKASIYEGGIRVPAVIRWKGKFEEGAVSDAPVIIEDLYATTLAVANIEAPSQHTIDGKNLVPVLSGNKIPKDIENRSMFFYTPYRFEGRIFNGPDFADGGVSPASAIIKQGWKLIYFHADQRFELYNLNEDIGENNNLFEVETKRAQKLVHYLDDHMRGNCAINSIQLPERIPTPWPLDAYMQSIKID